MSTAATFDPNSKPPRKPRGERKVSDAERYCMRWWADCQRVDAHSVRSRSMMNGGKV